MEHYIRIERLVFLLKHRETFALDEDDVYTMQCWLQQYVAEKSQWIQRKTGGSTKLAQMEDSFRFVLPEQLDRTKHEDVFDYDAWIEFHENSKSNTHGSKYPSEKHHLSYARDLAPEISGVYVSHSWSRPFGIIPEISTNGARRCIFVSSAGRRCKSYTHNGLLCKNHKKYTRFLKGYLMANGGVYAGMFKNSTLQEMYEDFKKSDARDITSEIAMMRTLLGSALKALPAEIDAGKLPIDILTHIMKMTNTITGAIEKYDRMQQRMGLLITPEQMTKLLVQILDIIRSTLDLRSEQYALLAEKMSSISIERQVLDYTLHDDNAIVKYGDEPTEAPEVKFSNRCTRYRKDGELRQVPIEAELAHHEEQQEYLASSRNADKRQLYYNDKDYLPHTTVGGREVEIGDEYDPYDTSR